MGCSLGVGLRGDSRREQLRAAHRVGSHAPVRCGAHRAVQGWSVDADVVRVVRGRK